jgi:hypothetical protein
MVWALASACDGISSRDPGIEGIAYIAGLVVDRLEALEERIGRLRSQEPASAA